MGKHQSTEDIFFSKGGIAVGEGTKGHGNNGPFLGAVLRSQCDHLVTAPEVWEHLATPTQSA